MNTFFKVAIAMVGMTGLAVAQPKDTKPAGDAKPAAAAADKGGAMEMKPPPELAEMAKGAAGTWHCKGQGMDQSQKMVDMTATLKMKLDIANWWMHGSFESRMGKEPFQFESFTTFDPKAKNWKRVMVESGGNWASGESAGLKAGKVDWEMTTHTPMMGDAMFRDHEDMSDPKAGAKMWGEFSPDKGKTWIKVYEMTCKK
jgi:hypothetical protein